MNRGYIDRLAKDATVPLVKQIKALHSGKVTMAQLQRTLTALGNSSPITEYLDALHLLHTLVDLDFPHETVSAVRHPAIANYFIIASLIHMEEAIAESKTEKRFAEILVLIQKAFEQNAGGKLPDDIYADMVNGYKEERGRRPIARLDI